MPEQEQPQGKTARTSVRRRQNGQLLVWFIEAMVRAWDRRALRQFSGTRIADIGIEDDSRQGQIVGTLHEGVRILYGGGETATIEWSNGVRQLARVPRRYSGEVWPGRHAALRTEAGHVYPFQCPTDRTKYEHVLAMLKNPGQQARRQFSI